VQLCLYFDRREILRFASARVLGASAQNDNVGIFPHWNFFRRLFGCVVWVCALRSSKPDRLKPVLLGVPWRFDAGYVCV